MRKFSLPSTNVPNATDHFTIGEISDLVSILKMPRLRETHFSTAHLDGFLTVESVVTAMLEGSQRHARLSETHLAQMENAFPPATARHTIVDDVVGAFPNVPAFLAGQPLSMRRRAPRENEGAPVTICVDVGMDAQVTPAAYAMRGAAVVALIRQIQSRRPVELYASCITGHGAKHTRGAGCYFFKLDTQPLDLARASFILGSSGFTRNGIYAANTDTGWEGQYVYTKKEPTTPAQGTRICQTAFLGREDVVYIPRARVGDPSLSQPVEWLKEQVSRFMGENLDEAA